MTTFNSVIAINDSYSQDILIASPSHGGMDLAETLDAQYDSAEQALEFISTGTTTTGGLADLFAVYPAAEYFHIFHDGEWTFLTRDDVAEMI